LQFAILFTYISSKYLIHGLYGIFNSVHFKCYTINLFSWYLIYNVPTINSYMKVFK